MKGKLGVLLMSFALFFGGVLTLQLERGWLRTTLLAAVFAALGAVAAVQTIRKRKK